MSEQQDQRERRVSVTFFGQEYTLITTAPQDEVEEILRLVRNQFAKLTDPSSRVVSEKVAILTCLNMAGDYVRLKKELERCRQQQRERIEKLTKRIESSLDLI